MLQIWAQALADSGLAATLRASIWLYPLVNAAHIVGIALLFGAIAALDLRLLGAWRSVPVAPLARVLVPVAAGGLAMALASGALLFTARAGDYVDEPLFTFKLALIAAALINAAMLRRSPAWRVRDAAPPAQEPVAWRLAAALSLLLWLAVITAGRLIGYR